MTLSFEPIITLSLIVLLGYLIGFSLPEYRTLTDPLAKFVFRVSLPFLVFSSFIDNKLKSITLTLTEFIYLISAVIVSLLSLFVIKYIFKQKDNKLFPVILMLSSITNVVHIGLPLLIQIFGSGDASIKIVLIHNFFLVPFVIMLLENSRNKTKINFSSFIVTLYRSLTTPLIFSVILGAIFFKAEIAIPSFLKHSIIIIGQSAVPCALISLGLFIATVTIKKIITNKQAFFLAFAKLILLPFFVLIFCLFLGVKSESLKVIVFVSALPAAINGYIVSKEYDSMQEVASASVCLSTMLAPITLLLWLTVLSGL